MTVGTPIDLSNFLRGNSGAGAPPTKYEVRMIGSTYDVGAAQTQIADRVPSMYSAIKYMGKELGDSDSQSYSQEFNQHYQKLAENFRYN